MARRFDINAIADETIIIGGAEFTRVSPFAFRRTADGYVASTGAIAQVGFIVKG